MNDNKLTIPGLIRKHAMETPEKTAFIIDDVSVSYSEFLKKMSGAAAFLSKKGVAAGTHVISMACPKLEYFVFEYAVLGLGAVHIPVENKVPMERLADIADQVDAEFVISPEDPTEAIGKKIPDGRIPQWISPDKADLSDCRDFEPVPENDECAEIVFTTGTTGKSKGVMRSLKGLNVYTAISNPTFYMNSEVVFLVNTPLNHAGALRRVHQCMTAGCTVVVQDGMRNLPAFFAAVKNYGVTHTYLPPASVKMLLTLAKKPLAELNGRLKYIYTASAPFPSADIEELMKVLPDTELHQGYGSSEIGGVCNCWYNAPGENPRCLGKPHPGVEYKLIDENGNIITEPEKEGRICLKSGMNMLGYYNEPELTASVMKDGYIYCSDLMYLDRDGKLFFAGRSDDVINIRGFKVAPTEVEDAVMHFEGISDCVCVPDRDKRGEICIKLLVVMKEGCELDSAAIKGFLETKVEEYKIPRIIERIDEVPRTFNGKIDRKKLIGKERL